MAGYAIEAVCGTNRRLYNIVVVAVEVALSFGSIDGTTTGSTMTVRVEVAVRLLKILRAVVDA
jgi:hypothetical protein